MIGSEQRKELGDKWFEKLQGEVSGASKEGLEDFRAAINPDAMGPDGKEGIDDAD